MTSRGHNLVFHMEKRPQKIIIRYSTQTNDLTKVITHYPMQKYDLKRSQSGILHRQTTSKDHNLVFHTDKRPQKIIIQYSTQTNDITHYPTQKYDLKRSQSGIPHGQTTSKDHNPVFHTDKRPHKGHNLVFHKDK